MCPTQTLCTIVLSLASIAPGAVEKPNVVLIITDDQGWFDLSLHGNPALETPTLDRLAGEGVEFTRFYCSPVCTPTRACLMTGRHYQRTGAIDTYQGRDVLDPREITLAQVFKKSGYKTGIFGKWHLGRYMKYHPNQRGFDEFFGFWQYGFINRYDDSEELFHNRAAVTTTGYVTDVLTDAAIDFVNANRERPFFLYVPFNAPHGPYIVPDKYTEKYLQKNVPLKNAQIYGMVHNIDENVDRLLKSLDTAGLRDNTIVIFMTDNGGVSSFYKAGLRGNKGSVYEGGVRVPFLIRWPGQFPAGAKVAAMAQHLDLFPTFCELLGVPLPDDRVIDGRSILKLMKEGKGESPHQFIYHQWNRVRPSPDQSWAISNGRHKLANGELFDLERDEGEKKNISGEHPDLARELRAQFERWFEDVTSGRDYQRVPIEVGREDENPVEIDLTWGEAIPAPGAKEPQLKIRYIHYNRDRVENWTNPQEAVRWKIDVVHEGTYEVTLLYGCRPGDEGSSLDITAGDARLRVKIEPTARPDVYQTFRAGTIDLKKGPATLEFKPAQIVGKELMVLHKIWLRRV